MNQLLLGRLLAGPGSSLFLGGPPGIGKSLFVAYVLLPEVWRRRTELGIAWILYRYHETLYIISESGIDAFGSGNYWVSNFDPRLRRMMTVLDISDTSVVPDRATTLGARHLLLVGSPAAGASAYGYLQKELAGRETCFLSPLSLDELIHMGDRFGISAAVVEERFATCGGSAQLVLGPEEEAMDPLDLGLGTLRGAVDQHDLSEEVCSTLESMSSGLPWVFDKWFADIINPYMFHMFPRVGNRSLVDYRIVSHRVAVLLGATSTVDQQRLQRLYVCARQFDDLGLAGDCWEVYVAYRLLHGAKSFGVRCQSEAQPLRFEKDATSQIRWEQSLKLKFYAPPFKGPLKAGVLYVPRVSIGPVVDFLWLAQLDGRDAVVWGQATIAAKLAVRNNSDAFRVVVSVVGDLPRVLVWLVPDDELFAPGAVDNPELWSTQCAMQCMWSYPSGCSRPR